MGKIADTIVRRRKAIIAIFLVAAVVCLILQFFVEVNYNMVDYLPPEAQSTKALDIMTEEFSGSIPNTNVMVRDVSIAEALQYKDMLAEIEGVSDVMWLDDMVDLRQPLEMNDSGTVEIYYKNGNALFSVTVDKGWEVAATTAIRELIGEDNAVSGETPDLATMMNATSKEVMGAVAILLPIIILILVLSTTSLVEPLLFLGTIGVAVLINMGTNIIFGEISFMTNSISPILQLACSLDYAIFLLHSFGANRQKYGDPDVAMKHAIKESMSTVAASAMTTLFGFLALVFMNFRIGADLGLNLAKGIVLSFLASMIFLPALTLTLYKLIDKTTHRPWMPSFKNVNRVLARLAVPIVIIVAILIVPAFLGQSNTAFIYGNEGLEPNGRAGRESAAIKEEFGQSTMVVLLVPKGDIVSEKALCDELDRTPHVTGIMAYASAVGAAIPPEYLSEDVTSQFYGESYARIIVYTDTATEGDLAFETVETIQAAARQYYGDEAYSLGQSTNLLDMKNFVKTDNTVVNLIAIIAIFLVLLITFRSATLPIILLLTIETGIWINLAIPYFTGTTINFIGYLVLSTVQLGATVDYAILLTTHYMRNRQSMPKREAIHISLGETFKSILVSGATLATAGFTLYATSTNPSICDIGLLLGRGTLLSMAMVVCFLPAMLTIFDKWIGKTTMGANFFRSGKTLNPKEESR